MSFLTEFSKRKEQKYLSNMKERIKMASDKELDDMNTEFHDGIKFDIRMGNKVSDVVYRVNSLIEEEMHKRNLQSCEDIEEMALVNC